MNDDFNKQLAGLESGKRELEREIENLKRKLIETVPPVNLEEVKADYERKIKTLEDKLWEANQVNDGWRIEVDRLKTENKKLMEESSDESDL